ncbi:MAG: HNH endonuclease [Chloroflexota bacterium]|nr:HNH endonuclease [Chloroflexota bacterium]
MIGIGKHKVASTHRVAWELTHDAIPDDLHVLHRCDNRKCVRPDHLFLGTNDDNIRDMVYKSRQARGEAASHKLSESDVREIRRLCAAGDNHQRIADMFGVHRGHISQIRRSACWKHVA